MPGAVDITRGDAQKLALTAQQLPRSRFARGLAGTLQAIEHLGYVQIDTISVVERAHHHTLWNRVPHYRHRYLDRLVRDRSIFEYWAHAAAYLPIRDYRFCLPRMHAMAAGQRHWYRKDQRLMTDVLARVRAEGPLQAKDFEAHAGNTGGMWEWGPVKQAIEYLFMQGELLVTRREGFAKVFDLAERVLPPDADTRTPSENEYAHHLIDRFLRANAIAREVEFGYLRKGTGAAIRRALAERVEDRKVLPVRIRGSQERYYVCPDFETLLARRIARRTVRVLSPFDNLVIQRRRVRHLFGFDYQLECYVPEAQRKFGYFCLPVLWQGRLVARVDCKADRRAGVFAVRSLLIEPRLRRRDEFLERLGGELKCFAQFNGCARLSLDDLEPAAYGTALRASVAQTQSAH